MLLIEMLRIKQKIKQVSSKWPSSESATKAAVGRVANRFSTHLLREQSGEQRKNADRTTPERQCCAVSMMPCQHKTPCDITQAVNRHTLNV